MLFYPLTSNLILQSKMKFSIFAILTIYSTVAFSFATRPNDFSSYGNESSEAFARRTYFMVALLAGTEKRRPFLRARGLARSGGPAAPEGSCQKLRLLDAGSRADVTWNKRMHGMAEVPG